MEVKVPKTTEEGLDSVVTFWHKREGDTIDEGEVLVEIQTEKAEFEVEAPASGRVAHILKERGEVVSVGEVIAVIDSASEVASSMETGEQEASAAVEAPSPETAPSFVSASPRVRKLARELGVDLTTVVGNGPGGRPTEEDVRKAAREDRPNIIPLTGKRRTIAERMRTSLQETAQLTETAWADITSLQEVRQSNSEVSLNVWVLRAVALALKQHPNMNASWTAEGIQQHPQVNLGVAVDTEDGLLVPVIQEADSLSIQELQEAVDESAQKARTGRLSREEMRGGTFTVSNLGAYGIQFFTPILNPPQAGILGVGKAEPKLELHNGKVIEKVRLPLSLTFDHRLVDGAPAARFMGSIIQWLQEPVPGDHS